MSDNKGVYPLDPTSEVGKFRLLVGDTTSEPYDPPQPGYQNYTLFSDNEITLFLTQSEGSLEGAAYFAYLSLASAAAMESKSVADLDLKVDTTKRSGDLRAIAALWKDRWDESVGAGDIFEVFDTVTPRGGRCELSEGVSCCGGRFL